MSDDSRVITLDSPHDYVEYREGSGASLEITNIQVRSERRVGHGRQLIKELVAAADRNTDDTYHLIYAITRESNRIAQQFYLSAGFRVVGVLYNFYPQDKENGVMYGLDL